ncbi:MAG: lipopolysaccharide biosynthesis protein, partial [Vicinamibacterales bacterium]
MARVTEAPRDRTPEASARPAVGGLGSYLLRATMVNWLSSLLTVLYALFITPIVIRALDKDLYGVWSFLNGLLAYSSLFYLGLGSAFIKYLSQFRAAGDRTAVNRLASVVFVIYTTIGVVSLMLCLALAPQVPGLFAEPLDPSATRQTVTALMLLGSRLLFMFVATVFSGVLIAEERITAAARVNIAATIARFIAVPLLLGHGPPLVTLAMIMSVSAAVETCALTVSALRFVPSLRIVPAVPRASELRMLYGFGFKSFFILLSAWLVNYTDTTIIGLRLGAASVAVYSIPLQLVAYGRVAAQGMVAALLPRLTAYETTGDRATLTAAYLRISRATNYVAALIALNLLTLGPAFMSLWVGDEFAQPSRVVLYLLTLAGYCYAVSTQTSVPFYQAMNSLRAPVVILLIEAIVNLGLSVWLSTRMGITGVA